MKLIAEIGTSHAGSIETAIALLDRVAEAGFDTAKFQWIYADEILHPNTGDVDLPGGAIALFDRFRELERDVEFYAALRDACVDRDLEFLCTAFGPRSLAELLSLEPTALKIASPELNYLQLLSQAAASEVPIYASTGVSTLADICEADATIESARMRRDSKTGAAGVRSAGVVFLHCVTAYPTPEEEYNLDVIESLHRVTGRWWGVSDHTLDPIAVPIVACAVGAVALEKHVTPDTAGAGLDDPVALPPERFTETVSAVRELETIEPSQRMSAVVERLGEERVTAIRGDGVKRLAPSERGNYGRTNRSLHVCRPIRAGQRIESEALGILRTERRLRPGIHPRYADALAGAVAVRDIEDGAGIVWDDVIARR